MQEDAACGMAMAWQWHGNGKMCGRDRGGAQADYEAFGAKGRAGDTTRAQAAHSLSLSSTPTSLAVEKFEFGRVRIRLEGTPLHLSKLRCGMLHPQQLQA